MKYLYPLTIVFFIVLFSSCRKDFNTSLNTGNLSFSQDTIFFNRVFDNISSSTHRFTVKNNSDKDIRVPNITLERGESSFYRLNIDGVSGKSFNDITILAKDSIYVFSEVTVDFNQVTDVDFMYRDKILFDNGTNEQKIELEAQVLDVHLIRPNRIQIDNGFDYEEIVLGQDDEGNDIGIRGTNFTENTRSCPRVCRFLLGFSCICADPCEYDTHPHLCAKERKDEDIQNKWGSEDEKSYSICK